MRKPRILGRNKTNYYHIMSRVVNGEFVFGDEEKFFFRMTMRKLERFMGVKILTYCIMSNHFHILLEVPEVKNLSDEEILDRLKGLNSKVREKEIVREYILLKEDIERTGDKRRLNAWRKRYLVRMGDLSTFGKELKERMAMWYNWKMTREGALWSTRFKSVVVEDEESALLTMAAYIDLNPVRAGIVKDSKEYHFCGYGEAMGGGSASKDGVCALAQIIRRSDKEIRWQDATSIYRVHLFAEGHGKGIDSKRVKEVLEAGGTLSLSELLRCRVRYFSYGLAFGSKRFVDDLFDKNRALFSERREIGALQVEESESLFFCLNQLRKEPIRAPN